MKKQDGFSLIEVVASILLISIILISFYPLLINSKKIAHSNIERLVVVNLADATLGRLKADPYSYIDKPSDNPSYIHGKGGAKEYSKISCPLGVSCALYELNLNERDYHVRILAKQDAKENEIGLIDVLITVENNDGKIKYSVEGYISYD